MHLDNFIRVSNRLEKAKEGYKFFHKKRAMKTEERKTLERKATPLDWLKGMGELLGRTFDKPNQP